MDGVATTDGYGFTTLADAVCPNGPDASPSPEIENLLGDNDLVAAMQMIDRLPLTDDEKAEAVRRLLASG